MNTLMTVTALISIAGLSLSLLILLTFVHRCVRAYKSSRTLLTNKCILHTIFRRKKKRASIISLTISTSMPQETWVQFPSQVLETRGWTTQGHMCREIQNSMLLYHQLRKKWPWKAMVFRTLVTLSGGFSCNWDRPERIWRPAEPRIFPALPLGSPGLTRWAGWSRGHDVKPSRNNATSGARRSISPPGKTTMY